MATLLEANGGGPQKQPKYTPIFMDRAFTGLYTQRVVLHDPSDVSTARFYGGRPEALWQGSNVELTNRLTLQRRPGLTALSSSVYSTPPIRAFSFQLADGTIRLIIDTQDSGALVLTAAANASGGNTVYTGTFPGGASNGYSGLIFTVSGFTSPQNVGTYTCTASTLTTLTLNNANGVSETHAATADTAGGVYYDQQNGVTSLLVAKSPGAGQTNFIAVAGVLYMGDGTDIKKYTPLNINGTIWNWGITAPATQPSVSITASGAAATVWQANTVFSTMGLTKDTNATPQIWQVIGVNADGTNTATAQFGTTGNGEPNWPTAEGATIVDGAVTWTNLGPVSPILPSTYYTDLGSAGVGGENYSKPGAGTAVNVIYGNYKNSGGLGNTGSSLPAFSGAYPGPSGGYFNNNTHWFAIGSYNTPAQTAAMRWKPSHTYTGWSAGGSSASILNGTPGFVLTGNLPAATGTIVYLMVPTTGGLSSSGYSPFPANAGFGATKDDGQVKWLCLGTAAWAATTGYVPWSAQGLPFGCVFDGTNFQVCVKSTGSGLTSAHQPGTALATTVSITTSVSGTQTTYTYGTGYAFTPNPGDQVAFSGFTNAGNNGTFSVISATSTAIVVNNPGGVVETHSATATFNPWATGYGSTTVDTGITWTCVGQNVPWAATQIWNLPTVGFQPPGPSEAFGGSFVDASGFVQAIIQSGKSGGSAPAWPVTIGSTVTDGTSPQATWQTVAAVSANSLAWSFGLAYAYSYKSRSVIDFYSPAPLGGGQTPPGSVSLGAPLGSGTNAISTASPVNQIVGANPGAVNTIKGIYSPDPQVDTIIIWRSADTASGSGTMFELTEIPNVPALAGVSQWSFNDYLPSVASGGFPGLNVLIPAPINSANNPPPSTFLPMVYNYQRIWGANGESVQFSGGPDVSTGNPNEAFNPADELPFLAPVVRLVKTPQGIVTFLTDSIEMIGGGPATATFFSVTMAPGVGLLSYNALDVFAGEIYFFSSDNAFRVITPSLNLSNFGFPLGDQFANLPSSGVSDTTWNPKQVYVAVHQNGIDNCIFVGDGSTGWYRLNPHQVPGAAQGPEPIWSPYANITNGCQMVQSVETSPGIKQLLVGGKLPGKKILRRSLSIFTDDGVAYDANFVMGSITLAHPGQLALLKFLEFDFSGVLYQPTISYLLNEISGTFTSFVNGAAGVPQFDPPSLYGDTLSPSTYSPNRYYFDANAYLARCRHLQIKVDFGTTSNADELYSVTVFGRLIVET
ncbi:Uncharacterised protein [uncultured archaeon]|nr:Uncharacterised protein [uncultured archaeon]